MSIQQISVFLENRPGVLNEMTQLLADHDVDIRALSLAETKDFGIARMIVNDAFTTAGVLKDGGFIAKFTPVLAFAVPDEPGGLNKLLNAFTDSGVNIEYMYSSLGGHDSEHAYMIFRVTDTQSAEGALAAKGFMQLTQEDIEAM